MLKFLRSRNIQKKIFIGLAVAVILTFLVSGVLISRENQNTSGLGRFNGRNISVTDYLRSYKAVRHEMSLLYGDKLKDIESFVNVKGEAWDRILLLDAAKKERIKVRDEEVVRWIMTQPAFLGKNGIFDERMYKLILGEYLRVNARDFEEEVRGRLTLNKLFDKIRSDVRLTDEELKAEYQKENGLVDLSYVLLPWEGEKDSVSVSEEELAQIYPVLKDGLLKNEKEKDEAAIKEEVRTMILKKKAVESGIAKLEALRPEIQKSGFGPALAAKGLTATPVAKFKKGSPLPGLPQSGYAVSAALSGLKEGDTSPAFSVGTGACILQLTKLSPTDETQFAKDLAVFKENATGKKAEEKVEALLTELREQLKLDPEMMKQLFPSDEPEPARD